MRVKKVSAESFERLVRAMGKHAQFVRLPSSVPGYTFVGIIGHDSTLVSWPDNLNEEEMTNYLAKYGSPPDIFELHSEKTQRITAHSILKYAREKNDEDISQ